MRGKETDVVDALCGAGACAGIAVEEEDYSLGGGGELGGEGGFGWEGWAGWEKMPAVEIFVRDWARGCGEAVGTEVL